MGFMGAWGFDPDEALEAMAGARNQPDLATSSYCANEEREAHIPAGEWSQICELRRMFRL